MAIYGYLWVYSWVGTDQRATLISKMSRVFGPSTKFGILSLERISLKWFTKSHKFSLEREFREVFSETSTHFKRKRFGPGLKGTT